MKAGRGSYFMRLIFLILFCFSLLAQDATSPIDPVLDWLPLDTETLVVANYQQTILQALGGANANDPSADFQYQHFAQIPSFLFTANTLLNRKMVYAATAARRFRLPPVTAQGLIPLGSGLNDSCTFIQYDQPVNDVVSQALAAYPRESVAGQATWIVTFQPHQQIGGIPNYRAWIVMLKPDLFLISPDRDFLETVLQRARKPKADKRAFPADSPIWKWTDKTASFWGARVYDPDSIDDPTSPFITKSWSWDDDKATAFTFQYDNSSRALKMTRLSGAPIVPVSSDLESGAAKAGLVLDRPQEGVLTMSATVNPSNASSAGLTYSAILWAGFFDLN